MDSSNEHVTSPDCMYLLLTTQLLCISVFEKLQFFEIRLTYLNYYDNLDIGKLCEFKDDPCNYYIVVLFILSLT